MRISFNFGPVNDEVEEFGIWLNFELGLRGPFGYGSKESMASGGSGLAK